MGCRSKDEQTFGRNKVCAPKRQKEQHTEAAARQRMEAAKATAHRSAGLLQKVEQTQLRHRRETLLGSLQLKLTLRQFADGFGVVEPHRFTRNALKFQLCRAVDLLQGLGFPQTNAHLGSRQLGLIKNRVKLCSFCIKRHFVGVSGCCPLLTTRVARVAQ